MGRLALLVLICVLPLSVAAQTAMNFGGLNASSSDPIEMSADSMAINQNDGSAVLRGGVIIAQGTMRLSAEEVDVIYTADGGIKDMLARGGVTFVTAEAAAESETAEFAVTDNVLILIGDVLVTQGPSAAMAERMRIDVTTGDAVLEGRVRTVLQPQN